MKKLNMVGSSASLLAAGLLFAVPAHALIVFTYENPGVQSTSVAGVTTEDFNDGSYANSPAGTFSGGTIVPANQFGGAGGILPFLAATTNGPTTLTFNLAGQADQNYLGFWWSAGDAANVLDFYDAADVLLGHFTTATVLGILPSTYYGNPNPSFLGQNSAEPYAYLNFTNVGGNPIHKVVFSGANFELDNISVTAERVAPPGNPVPEGGSSLFLLAMAVLGTLGFRSFVTSRIQPSVR